MKRDKPDCSLCREDLARAFKGGNLRAFDVHLHKIGDRVVIQADHVDRPTFLAQVAMVIDVIEEGRSGTVGDGRLDDYNIAQVVQFDVPPQIVRSPLAGLKRDDLPGLANQSGQNQRE
jgi:hypothetical protein